MKSVLMSGFGGPDILHLGDVDPPKPANGHVVIKVVASGVNRADLHQRAGHYPAPPGESDTLGLEVSGTVESIGSGVTTWKIGDHACALLSGGGYAEYVSAPVELLLPVPRGVALADAAALPEAACTVLSNLRAAAAAPGETILIHGGAGGIGSMAIQIAKAWGLRVLATAGSAARVDRCREHGADAAFDHTAGDFSEWAASEGGADIILDVMGAAYLEPNLRALNSDGRLVVIGLQGGATATLPLGALLARRQRIIGTTLRSRPLPQRAAIVADVLANVWPWIPDHVRPTVAARFPLADAAAAHTALEAGGVEGKILLIP